MQKHPSNICFCSLQLPCREYVTNSTEAINSDIDSLLHIANEWYIQNKSYNVCTWLTTPGQLLRLAFPLASFKQTLCVSCGGLFESHNRGWELEPSVGKA